ncbi:MAG: hypothetical protein K0S65_4195 [Labilithrix sp.]|nr:hypothetical protein [Labilithrix sp.]
MAAYPAEGKDHATGLRPAAAVDPKVGSEERTDLTTARRACGTIVTLLSLVSSARTARAEGAVAPNVNLRYFVADGIRGCLSESEFDEAVRLRLRDSSFSGSEAITLTTKIEIESGRLRATLTLREGGLSTPATEAKQELFARPDECATISATAALAASLTLQRTSECRAASLPAPRAEATPLAPAVPPAKPAPPRIQVPAPASPPLRPLRHVRTHVLLNGGYGLLPSASAGATFGASLVHKQWSAELEAGGWLPATVTEPSGRGGGRAWLVFSGLAACVHPEPLFVCGVGVLGTFRASGTGRLLSRSGDLTYLAFGPRVGAEISLSPPFSLVVQGTALLPIRRPSLSVSDELVWRAPLLGGELGIGIGMSIL